MTGLRAGRAHDPDPRLILARDDASREAGLLAGRAHADTARLILAQSAGTLTLSGVSRIVASRDDRVIPALGDAQQTSNLLAGAGKLGAHDRVILSRNDASPPLIAVSGGVTTHPQVRAMRGGNGVPRDSDAERVILARDDQATGFTAMTGGGAAHPHERAILARDEEWLRPSLVAGSAE